MARQIRALSERPNLEQYRKQAKELVRDFAAGDAAARARVGEFLQGKEELALADAQFVLAREHGFENWGLFKKRVEELQSAGDPVEAFRAAIRSGDAGRLRKLMESHPELREQVNAPLFAFGARPIKHARRHPEVVDVLLRYGADINLKSDWWAGPWGVLEDADDATAEFMISRGAVVDIFAACHLGRIDRVRELLDADPSLVHARGGDGCLPLHFARTAEIIDLLLERGAEIDARDVDHEGTAAQWAVPSPIGKTEANEKQRRGLARVRHLLERGAAADVFMAAAVGDVERLREVIAADPGALEARVGSPESSRTFHRSSRVVKEALEARVGSPGYAPCPVAPGGHIYVYSLGTTKTPHEVAAEFGSDACLEVLLEHSTPKQRFLAACAAGDEAAVRQALREQPDLVATLTAQEQAALPNAAWNGRVEGVRVMLDAGFDPLAQGPDGGTVLHCAAWQGWSEIVELILNHPRARGLGERLVNATEPTHQSTPLGWCCHGSRNCGNPAGDYPRVARLLCEAGGKPGHNTADAVDAVAIVLREYQRM
jgi:ankyrin repeat protein